MHKEQNDTVWIVIVNGKIEVVFDTLESAQHHAKEKQRGWNTCEIIEKEVQQF